MNAENDQAEELLLPPDQAERIALRADSLLFSQAQSTGELEQAYRLVYRNYLRAEYIDSHPSEMRYTAHNALPTTTTFVAKLRENVVTTATVVFDSPLGLPLEAIYHDEVDELRRQHARLCEVSMLADRRRVGMRTIPSLLQLFKMIFHYTLKVEKATDVVITVNPSHEAFYTRYLPFEDLAGLRYYPAVKDAPAVAKRANLASLMEKSKWSRLYEFFLHEAPPGEVLRTGKRFSEDELREFFVVRRDIFRKLPPFALDHVRSLYPECDFNRILAPVDR